MHETLGSISAWLLVAGTLISLYLHLKGRLSPLTFLIMLFVLATAVLITGYTGGELVYRYRVGVNR